MNQVDIVRTASELRLVLGQLIRRIRTDNCVPSGQLAVLGALDREGPQTTSDLAGVQHVRPQSMARTVTQLVHLGYVGQRPHPNDGRKTLLVLTDWGRQALHRERERRVDWFAEAIATQLTPVEQEVLASSVALLARLRP